MDSVLFGVILKASLCSARPKVVKKFFCSHLKGKNVGDAWLGTVEDKINIYRLKIVKKSGKLFS